MNRRDFGHLLYRGTVLNVRYSVNGKRTVRPVWKLAREYGLRVSKPPTEADGVKVLTHVEAQLGLGVYVDSATKRTTFEDMAQGVRDDYRVKGRRSGIRLERSLRHLLRTFRGVKAASITTDRVRRYEASRLDEGAARATINQELAALRRMFRLAREAGKVTHVPIIHTPDPHNARKGFFERADFQAVLKELPESLRAPIAFAYLTGWRVPTEVLTLTWARVDFTAGVLRLDVGETKNTDGRTFPFDVLPELRDLLEKQRGVTAVVERRLGAIVPWVFHRDGKPIRDFRTAWKNACDRAAHVTNGPVRRVVRPALLGRIPHDFRRTAVRNLERAGVSRSVAKKLTGHKTESVYNRYAIVAERDLREGVEKLATLHGQKAANA